MQVVGNSKTNPGKIADVVSGCRHPDTKSRRRRHMIKFSPGDQVLAGSVRLALKMCPVDAILQLLYSRNAWLKRPVFITISVPPMDPYSPLLLAQHRNTVLHKGFMGHG